MKKILALLFVVAIAAPAFAQDSAIWCDIRSNANDALTGGSNRITVGSGPTRPWIYDDAGAVVPGGRGYGQVVYLEPKHSDGAESLYPNGFPKNDGNTDRSNCDAYIYMDVFNDASGTNGVISSIGYDITVDENVGGGGRNRIGHMTYSWVANPPAANGGKVDGTASSLPAGTMPMTQTGCKLVQVPVCDEGAGPVFCTSPMFPVGGPYQLAKLVFDTADVTRTCGNLTSPLRYNADQSIFNMWLTTNNLLITRTFQTGGDGNEMVSFGYLDGLLDAALSGSTPGVRSANPDLIVKVWVKGDFTRDGRCTSADTNLFLAALGAANDNPDKTFRGDFTPDAQVTSADMSNFLNCYGSHSICP